MSSKNGEIFAGGPDSPALSPILGSAPRPQSSSETQEFLVFRLGGREFALPAEQLREIRGTSDLNLVSAPTEILLGTISITGRPIPVVPLHRRLHLRWRGYTGRAKIVVAEAPAALFPPRAFAWLADSVSRMEKLYPHEFEVPLRRIHREPPPECSGVVLLDGRQRPLLDAARILQPNEFAILAGFVAAF